MARPRREDDMVIRERQPADDEAIRQLNDQAFVGPHESTLIGALRATGLAVIELVAIERAAIAGHILFSSLDATLDGRSVRMLALAPMSVAPGRRNRGIGSELVRNGLAQAREGGWEAVIVLGHPHYYPRFGFSAAPARHLAASFSGDAFMALALSPGALDGMAGRVIYPAAFDSLP
jgi:putative acetyltransferase